MLVQPGRLFDKKRFVRLKSDDEIVDKLSNQVFNKYKKFGEQMMWSIG